MLQSLLGKGYDVIVRPHPEYKKRYGAKLDALINRWQDYKGDDLRFETDFSGNETIYGSDLVITDWSGTAYEFSFITLKPCVFIDTPPKINNPDYDKITVAPLEFTLRDRIGVRVAMDEVKSMHEKTAAVLQDNQRYAEEILSIRNTYIANFGSFGKAAYRVVMDAIKEQAAARKDD